MLKGIGATLALPVLDAMRPLMARALERRISRCASPCSTCPTVCARIAGLPTAIRHRFKLSPILTPLEKHREDILILTGLQNKASFTGDGHYVKTGGWLTGTTIAKTTGSDINAGGISMDQIAAHEDRPRDQVALARTRHRTRRHRHRHQRQLHPPLRVPHFLENPDRSAALRAQSARRLRPLVPHPLRRAARKQAADQQSVLDLVRDDAKRLQTKLGSDRTARNSINTSNPSAKSSAASNRKPTARSR